MQLNNPPQAVAEPPDPSKMIATSIACVQGVCRGIMQLRPTFPRPTDGNTDHQQAALFHLESARLELALMCADFQKLNPQSPLLPSVN